MLKAKTYYCYETKTLYGVRRYFLQDKFRIECLGGEDMTEEKKLVFLNPEDVPTLVRGAKGKDWNTLFDQIPKGKVLAMPEGEYGTPGNIRTVVKNYNDTKKAKVLKASGRTDKATGKVTVYVQRVA